MSDMPLDPFVSSTTNTFDMPTYKWIQWSEFKETEDYNTILKYYYGHCPTSCNGVHSFATFDKRYYFVISTIKDSYYMYTLTTVTDLFPSILDG